MVACRNPNLHVAVGDLGLFRNDADVGQEGHGQPRADRHAVDGRDDGFVTGHHVVDHFGRFGERIGDNGGVAHHGRYPFEVTAGREGLIASTCDNSDFCPVVICHNLPYLRQFPVQARVGGVKDLGPVDGDQQHAVGFVVKLQELELFKFHGVLSCRRGN